MDNALVTKALLLCVEEHGKQKNDRDGNPHYYHSVRVAMKQKTPERVVIALLHDVLEDCGMELYDKIEHMVGNKMMFSIWMLTRPEGMPWNKYIENVMRDEDAMWVKLSDIEDNVAPGRLDEQARKNVVMYHEAYADICDKLKIRRSPPSIFSLC